MKIQLKGIDKILKKRYNNYATLFRIFFHVDIVLVGLYLHSRLQNLRGFREQCSNFARMVYSTLPFSQEDGNFLT